MIGRTNAGSGGMNIKDYAISVTFPAGSECTCTDGTKVLKSKGAQAGMWIFPVYPGTWTVTITDGTKAVSKSVTISESNKTQYIDMGYAYYVIKDGYVQHGLAVSLTKNDGDQKYTQGVAYEGGLTVYVYHYNSEAIFNVLNITVPSYASTMHIRMRRWWRNGSNYNGGKQATFGGANFGPAIGEEGWIPFLEYDGALDVQAMRGGAYSLAIPMSGNTGEGRDFSCIGDVWFD